MMKNRMDKLASRGAAALDDAELLSVLMAEGLHDDDAVALADRVVEECGTAVELSRVDFSRLRMMAGMGRVRAARLKAAVELGRRVASSDSLANDAITSDADVVRIMRPAIGALQHEECWALYLASSGRILERMRISQGGVQATVVDCKLIIKRAIELLAVQIVLVHNHPSGSAEPSRQDRELTERVAEAAKIFDIRLLDHVVVTHTEHYSFRANGIVK